MDAIRNPAHRFRHRAWDRTPMHRCTDASAAGSCCSSAPGSPPPMGLSSAAGVRMAEAATAPATAAGHLAARPGMHRLHRIAAALLPPDAGIDPARRHLARLSRHAVRRRRKAGARLQARDDGEAQRQVRAGDRGRHADEGRRHLLQGRRQDPGRARPRGRRRRGRRHRHRLVRFLGRHPIGRSRTRPARSARRPSFPASW